MDAFWQNVTMSLVTGVIAGVITGILSGYLVTRISRFCDLKNEARRIIWQIDFMYHQGQKPTICAKRPVGELLFVSGELYSLRHQNAGDTISRLMQEISATLAAPPQTSEEMDRLYTSWQKTCRELKPSWCSILSLNLLKV